MFPRLVLYGICVSCFSGFLEGQSHVERFAPPQARLEKVIQETTSRLQKDPADTGAWRLRGITRLQLGQTQVAIEDLTRAVELEPSLVEAWAQLSLAYSKAGQIKDAETAVRRALDLDPNHLLALAQLGRLLLSQMQGEEAASYLERAVELNPQSAELRFDLMTSYRGADKTIEAAAQLRILRSLLPPTDPRLIYAEGLIAGDFGQLESAVERFRKAMEAGLSTAGLSYDLGVALIQMGHWGEATAIFEKLAEEQPQSAEIAYFHALSLYNIKLIDEAEAEVRRALQLYPDSASALTLAGLIEAFRDRPEKAIELLEKATVVDSANFDAWFNLARTRFALSDLEAALVAFEKAVALNPNHIQARFFQATVLEALGSSEQASAQYETILNLDPQRIEGYLGLGAILSRKGEYARAIGLLSRAVEVSPQNFEARLELGKAQSRLGHWQEAVRSLRAAVALQPERPDAHYQLAAALQRSGQVEEARKEFAIVEQLNEKRRKSGMAAIDPNEKQTQ